MNTPSEAWEEFILVLTLKASSLSAATEGTFGSVPANVLSIRQGQTLCNRHYSMHQQINKLPARLTPKEKTASLQRKKWLVLCGLCPLLAGDIALHFTVK